MGLDRTLLAECSPPRAVVALAWPGHEERSRRPDRSRVDWQGRAIRWAAFHPGQRVGYLWDGMVAHLWARAVAAPRHPDGILASQQRPLWMFGCRAVALTGFVARAGAYDRVPGVTRRHLSAITS